MDHPFLCSHVLVVMTLIGCEINPLNAELNPIYHFLALLGAHPILHISVVRVKLWLMLNLSPNIVTVIKVHRLECLGDVVRMDSERTVTKFLQGKPGGQKKGGPR
jgi:hypothetical protein